LLGWRTASPLSGKIIFLEKLGISLKKGASSFSMKI